MEPVCSLRGLEGLTYAAAAERREAVEALERIPYAEDDVQDFLYWVLANPPTWRRTRAAGARPVVYVVLDTETTGLFTGASRALWVPMDPEQTLATHTDVGLLEVAWAVVEPETWEVRERFAAKVRPRHAYSRVYDRALYDEAEAHGQAAADVLGHLAAALGRLAATRTPVLVIHNVAYDRKVIAYALAAEGMRAAYAAWLGTPMVCTMVSVALADRACRVRDWARLYVTPEARTWPRLQTLHYFFRGAWDEQTHRAAGDVQMVCDVLPRLADLGWLAEPDGETWTPEAEALYALRAHVAQFAYCG